MSPNDVYVTILMKTKEKRGGGALRVWSRLSLRDTELLPLTD